MQWYEIVVYRAIRSRLSARSFAHTAHSFTCSALLMRIFAHSVTRSCPHGSRFMSINCAQWFHIVSAHRAQLPRSNHNSCMMNCEKKEEEPVVSTISVVYIMHHCLLLGAEVIWIFRCSIQFAIRNMSTSWCYWRSVAMGRFASLLLWAWPQGSYWET